MKIKTFLVLLFLSFNVFAFPAVCDVAFSPNGTITVNTVKFIDSATTNVKVHTYQLTSKPIVMALINAKKRDVNVTAVVDSSQVMAIGSQLINLKKAGISVYVDKMHNIQHNKVIIVDDTRFQTGSFNLSANAQTRNAENAIICNAPEGTKQYVDNFNIHLSHSQPL